MPIILVLLVAIILVLIGGWSLLAGVVAVPAFLLWNSGFFTALFFVGATTLIVTTAILFHATSKSKFSGPLTNPDGTVAPEYLADMQRRTEEYKRRNGLT